MSKYNAIKTVEDGIKFDSKKEAARYLYLKKREDNGEIYGLELQKKFVLIPKKKLSNTTLLECSYIADFFYIENGETIVEDVKGMKKGAAYAVFVIKKKLMYQVHNILIDEI